MSTFPPPELAFPGGRLERAVNEKLLADAGTGPAIMPERASGTPSGLADILPCVEIVQLGACENLRINSRLFHLG
ncbi:MAG: hypothetical protein IPM23_24925 [Candidatus Melainabacteria bacterium]|nr:hypothetical protein [Candidatus Melainabacteria bacterium]